MNVRPLVHPVWPNGAVLPALGAYGAGPLGPRPI